jgi:hypothetical protein
MSCLTPRLRNAELPSVATGFFAKSELTPPLELKLRWLCSPQFPPILPCKAGLWAAGSAGDITYVNNTINTTSHTSSIHSAQSSSHMHTHYPHTHHIASSSSLSRTSRITASHLARQSHHHRSGSAGHTAADIVKSITHRCKCGHIINTSSLQVQ